MSAPKQVVDWLLEVGLIDPARLLDEELTLRDVSRRNRNTIVEWPDGSGYIVKQARDSERQASLANEWRLTESAALLTDRNLRAPHPVRYDDATSRLVLELAPRTRPLRSVVRALPAVPAGLARRVGRTLKALHKHTPPPERASEKTPAFWVARLVAPALADYARFSGATRVLVAALQSSRTIRGAVEELAADEGAVCFVHGDIRWDNVLVETESGRLWLIDWELAHWGNPLLDVGGFLADCLWHWLTFVPTAGEMEANVDAAAKPLRGMQSCFRAFWEAYGGAARGVGLHRLTRFCAIKLVQASFERTQVADQFDRRIVLLLQLAENMLAKPESAERLLSGDRDA